MTQQVYADNINEGITVYERVVNDTYQIVNGTIDTNRLSEENYLENYSNNILSPIMLGIEEEIDKSGGIYIVFDSKYTGRTEGFWIGVDENLNKISGLPTNIAGISEDDPSVGFYYDSLRNGKAAWGEYYTNDANSNVVSYSTPLVVNGQVIGMIGMDMLTGEIENMINDIKVYDTGYAFLLNEDFDYILHPTIPSASNLRTLENGRYNELADEIERGYGFN